MMAGKILKMGFRQRTITSIVVSFLLLLIMVLSGLWIGEEQLEIQPEDMNEAPSLHHLFGTDWLGRDMLTRTFKGVTISFGVGILAAFSSTVIALVFSLLASVNGKADRVVTWLIDLFLSVPHIVLLLLISFAMGGGFQGVVVGLAFTHWPSLTRVLRAEMLQVKNAEYVSVSRKLGKSRLWIARHHIIPHLRPQLFIGFVLLFPHAILHEAAITFLGFGLPPEQPAIGIILSESMLYLSTGMWWLAVFPGLSLLLMVALFDILGRNLRKWADPFHGQKGV
ncbi:ABC transporter permease [Salimicrobium album]|uniref:Peptide/nickel transport system permease protein n=1 Tax=Salimicrobium album TaxID=50717 RepID=A0A1H3H3D6_9BACI|nr:ABC transporter permease [Salimicrobium album]SDY10032.1 peptide/nickel transport system permease protein [Salimicrobium album]